VKDSATTAIELATADEAALISNMAAAIWPACYAKLLSPEQIRYMLDWMYAPERIRQELKDQAIDYRWLLLADERVGFSASELKADELEMVIHKLYVKPHAQGHGVGTVALAAIEESARAHGAECMKLRVNRGNQQAIHAYEKFGFERDYEVCSDIGGGFVMDDYVMVKALRE